MDLQKCVLCGELDLIPNLQKISEKGVTTLNEAISRRKDKFEQVLVGQFVHQNCRKNYSSERKILQALNNYQSSSKHSILTSSVLSIYLSDLYI